MHLTIHHASGSEGGLRGYEGNWGQQESRSGGAGDSSSMTESAAAEGSNRLVLSTMTGSDTGRGGDDGEEARFEPAAGVGGGGPPHHITLSLLPSINSSQDASLTAEAEAGLRLIPKAVSQRREVFQRGSHAAGGYIARGAPRNLPETVSEFVNL